MASITSEEAQIVAKLPRRDGRLQLACFLDWEEFDEEDSFQRGLELDYLYDNLMFAVGKGFPWPTACILLTLADEMLQQSKGKPLLDSVKIFSSKIKSLVPTVNEQHLKTYTGFFFDTFFHHYKLYQCVFTTKQDKMQIKKELEVTVPPAPCPMKEGKDIAVWEYQKKVAAVEQKEEAARNEREAILQKMRQEHKAMLEENEKKVQDTHMPLERQELLQIMQEVAANHVTATSANIRHKIRSSMEDLALMLEKTVIPRPHALARPSWLPPAEEEEEEEREERANTIMSLRTFTAQGRTSGAPPRYKLKEISATKSSNSGRSSKARKGSVRK